MAPRTILTPWGPLQSFTGSTNPGDYLMIEPDPTKGMTTGQAREYHGRINGAIVWDAYNREKNGTMPEGKSLKGFWHSQSQQKSQGAKSAQRASKIEGIPYDDGHGISAKDKAPGNIINRAPQIAKGETGNRAQGGTTAVTGYNIDEMGIPRNMMTAWYYYLADIKDENNITAKGRARILHLGKDAVEIIHNRQLELRNQQHPMTAPVIPKTPKPSTAVDKSGPVKVTPGTKRAITVVDPNKINKSGKTSTRTVIQTNVTTPGAKPRLRLPESNWQHENPQAPYIEGAPLFNLVQNESNLLNSDRYYAA